MDILSLIPQREPMVMVSGVVSASENSFTTTFLPEEGNIFMKDGCLQESGLIENIAQSAAAMNGYRALLDGEPVKNGYIGGVKNLEIHELPGSGVRLTTRVTETYNVMDTSIIEGEVRTGDQLIARCEMKVFMQP
ncbi:MAG: 3-hydroxyacyl-ACP dehydratase [Bacteroidetes bacterium]|nr:3-hydroxyacyl-ACP dehydratase [Bacteroidota bacterium]